MSRKSVTDKHAASDWMMSKLAESGLDGEDAKALRIKSFTEADSATLKLSRTGAGFKIPYFDATGKRLPMFRYRYQVTEYQSGFLKGTELRKYDQPAKTDPEIYLPTLKGINWPAIATDETTPLFVTEGELKAACATKHGFVTLGLGGVYSFGRKARWQDMLPELTRFKWAGRQVYICYDSDAISNRLVMTAEVRLARLLTDKGAYVRIVRLPQKDDKKVGLDDFIVAHGPDAFQELVERTEEYGPFEALHQLNTEVLYVRHPSMVVVHPADDHPKGQPRYRTVDVGEFIRELYANRTHFESQFTANGEKRVEVNTADKWMKWRGRAEAHSMTYAPGEPHIVGNQFNAWDGWGVEPRKGDVSLFLRLFNHLTEGLTTDQRKWLLQWFAYPLQYPGAKLYTAVVLWTPRTGVGKSLLGYTMREVYGEANWSEVTKDHLESEFNPWLRYKQFVMGEEITGSDSKDVNRLADKLKHLITARSVIVNGKYTPHFEIPNTVNYYFTSNHPNAFLIKDDDRRYFVHEVTSLKLEQSFFDEYDAWYRSREGAAAVMHHLLYEVDTTGFNPKSAAPRTAAREAMIESSFNASDRLAHELKNSSDSSFFGPAYTGRDIWTLKQVIDAYQRSNLDDEVKRINEWSLGKAMREAGFQATPDSVEIPRPQVAASESIATTKVRLWVVFRREKYNGHSAAKLRDEYVDQWGLKWGKEARKVGKKRA